MITLWRPGANSCWKWTVGDLWRTLQLWFRLWLTHKLSHKQRANVSHIFLFFPPHHSLSSHCQIKISTQVTAGVDTEMLIYHFMAPLQPWYSARVLNKSLQKKSWKYFTQLWKEKWPWCRGINPCPPQAVSAQCVHGPGALGAPQSRASTVRTH